jgi:uncharacterized membrane protein
MIESWITSFYQFLNRMGYDHPLHPAAVHIPIGMIFGVFIFGWLAFLFKKDSLARTARHCLILALIFWFPVVLLGTFDWQHFYKGAWLGPIKVKLVLAGILVILLALALILDLKRERSAKALMAVITLALGNAIFLGYFGAQLIYGKVPESSRPSEIGQKIYMDQCASCHPNGGNTITPNSPVTHSAKLNNMETFVAWIRNPKPPMPPFKEPQISSQQAQALYDYISKELNRLK